MINFIKTVFEALKTLTNNEAIIEECKSLLNEIQITEEDFLNIIFTNKSYNSREGCLKCCSKSIVKHGFDAKGNQRYKCKQCEKTFSNVTDTPMSYSKKSKEKWIDYFKQMCDLNSVRECAKGVKISIVTSFQWRHKILKALMLMLPNKLGGIIEIDEINFPESFKGNHSKDRNFVLGRPPIKRKLTASEYFSIRKISVLCCKDRLDKIFSSAVDRCVKARADKVYSLLNGKVLGGSVICANNNLAYIYAAQKLQCKLYKMPQLLQNKQRIPEAYHIDNAKNFGKRVRYVINYVFHGVATKYLNFYLAWIQWLEQARDKTGHYKLIDIISKSVLSRCKLRIYEFKMVTSL